MTNYQLYLIEYDYSGQEHGDVFVVDDSISLSPEIQALDWLTRTFDTTSDSFEIISCNHVNSLSTAYNDNFQLSPTISDYLNQVLEGSRQ